MIVARSSGPAAVRRRSSSSSSTSTPVDLPDVGDVGEVGVDLVEPGEVVRRLENQRHGSGVAQVPLHLRRRGRLVHGHEQRPGEPGREVDEGPFVAGAAHEPDGVAGTDAGGDQALGEGPHPGQEVGCADVRPPPDAVGDCEERGVGRGLDAVDQEVGRIGVHVGLHGEGDGVFVHGSSFGTERWSSSP
jgi:hypothetical protein